ncbi:pentatricopeptide repeat-containing protein At2g35030, mitochondrial-like [Selaginella moellendorffii]|uniref:pentatricopeptide repeat-containing protein At2g35030, mitochondrial-like n=1 Tax=Selaginella moellendorffii TaxID=88036 RepID=UPI000D1CEAC9|nr:pentatricopeptide repeat-containing protein At2g35030, mitochondrial-like [Selaginella moellendorffii]|eukprot:XP_024537540.1 pentatricopeptide repeat-containing protein At2g35030, mitochondrial-like [Selaginella moellendorffii]
MAGSARPSSLSRCMAPSAALAQESLFLEHHPGPAGRCLGPLSEDAQQRYRAVESHNAAHGSHLLDADRHGSRRAGQDRGGIQAMPERSAVAWNAMIQASCQEGDVDAAASLFTAKTPGRDCSSWTSMISGYARNDRIGAAVAVFWRMPTWSLISWNAMAIAPAESGDLSSAKNLLDRIPEKNCVSWNAMIQAYTASGGLIAAVEVFDRMPQPDVISFTTIAVAIAQGGDLDRARALLDAMPERNLVSRNAMMAGYAQSGVGDHEVAVHQSQQSLLDGLMICPPLRL